MQISDEQKREIARQARVALVKRYAAEKDILSWGALLFPDKFPLDFCAELHGYFVSIRGDHFTNTEAPRNHAKTIIKCFLIPLFQALNEPEPYRHYLNVQATDTKAQAVNLAIRYEIEYNELLKEVYGEQADMDKWTERQFALKNGIVFTGIGAGGSLRGLNYKGSRPDYIIIDDLYDEEDINNTASTEKKNSWFWGTLYLARAKNKQHCIHVQGTAINKSDLLFDLQKKSRWTSRTFKAIKDFDTQEVLWPELNSYADLMAEKDDMPSTIFFREFQNERRDEESSIIKSHWLKYYDEIPSTENVCSRICGVDPSIGQKEINDYTGIAVIVKTKASGVNAYRYYIKDVYYEHLSLDARIRFLESLHAKENFTQAPVEGIAGFKDFVAELKRRTNLPVKEIDNVKDKIAHLESKSHWFENGKVFINKNMQPRKLQELVEQLTNNFPAHDDVRDAVLHCISNEGSGIENLKKMVTM